MNKVSNKDSVSQELLNKYLEISPKRAEGETLEGIVIQLDSEFAYLDVGMKSEGCVPLGEFDEAPKIGDAVSCILVMQEGGNGNIVVSKRKADFKNVIKNLSQSLQNKNAVQGKILKIIKGGFSVDLGSNLIAFLPISRADISRVENPEQYIDMSSYFYLERLYDNGKISPVVDRRSYLEDKNNIVKDKFFDSIKIDDIVEGTIRDFASFGVFVDLGGFDGLLHVNDISWSRLARPRDYVSKGQILKLKVIRIDKEEKKVNLGLKHLQQDPWVMLEENFNVGDIIEGKVTKIMDFGAFIEVGEGLEGLVHISELSWIEHVKHPKEILSVGEQVKVCILNYSTDERRISLGLKQTMSNPWDSVIEKYPVGTKISGKIKKITSVGAFITLEKGIDGFLHIDNISWEKRVRNFSKFYKIENIVDAVILSVNSLERRIDLGIKQMHLDPWVEILAIQKRKEPVETEVISKTDFGIFVKIDSGLEGLIHKSHLIDEEENILLEKIQIGDKVMALVLTVFPEQYRLSLSVRNYIRSRQEKELGRYLEKSNEKDSKYTLADAWEKKI